MSTPDIMLEIKDLYVNYGGICAVQGVNLNIRRGSIVTLVGANGAGKSSIIRSIAGLNRQVTGDILFSRKQGDKAESIIGLKPENMVRRGISLSPEGRRILPHLTVQENLMLGAYSRNDREGIQKDIERVYELFPRLEERHWQKGGTLSGGEQQMLAVGRALMSQPDLIMLDEPSLGLAPLLVKEIFSIIERIEKLNEDAAAIAADIKEIYSEAKSAGFDPKYIRQMIRLRKMDPDELDEADELTQMYRTALGL